MAAGHNFRDNQPIGYLGRLPIYMALLLATLHGIGFILSQPSLAAEFGRIFQPFDPASTLHHGVWWQPLTYALTEGGNLFALLSISMIYLAGVEVEKFFGRWAILRLYGLLIFTPPLVSTLCWLGGYSGPNLWLAGCTDLSLGFIVAFATLYPRAELSLGLTARTVTLFFIGLRLVLQASDRDGVGMAAVLASCGVASFFILRLRHGSEFGFSRLFQGLRWPAKPRVHVLPDPPRRKVPSVPLQQELETEDVDALLDKIAKSGLASLTTSERRKLEAVRQELLKKSAAKQRSAHRPRGPPGDWPDPAPLRSFRSLH